MSSSVPAAFPLAAAAAAAFDAMDEPLALPAERPAPARPSVPVLATFVPVLGAVGLWLVTGSILSLWLAALGPLIAGATVLDGLRVARRERRRGAAETAAAHASLVGAIGARHTRERERRRERHPDVARYATSSAEVWRAVPGRAGALAVGTGTVQSVLQLSGGGLDAENVALRRRARLLPDAPITVPASGALAIAGPAVLVGAVARALVLQACLASPPGELRLVGPLAAEDAWADALPHRHGSTGAALAIIAAGDDAPVEADLVIVRCDAEGPVPPGCSAVLTIATPGRALLDAGGEVQEIAVEGISSAQAEHFARELAARAGSLAGRGSGADQPVALRPLLADVPSGGLSAVIGLEGGATACVDLVADGPHAVVAGMTGTGKSELLVTWILALCAARSPREVSFLLADFKGGTAFDPLAALPHVTGVITDLDGAGARRAIESLRAEVRWREAELARVGARDVLDPRVELPRLVVVVDEFAALLGDHPELHAVFTDIAARGRALGMHLVLGTQRVAGVVRDALLANCPLRISLRVADAADSRAVIGTDDASRLPGGVEGRGIALVRRSSDGVPRRIRVALSAPEDLGAIVDAAEAHRPRRPWLPDLPRRLDLEDMPSGRGSGELVLGLADEPDRQRQVPVFVRTADRGVLVVGAGGRGKSTALHTLAIQAASATVVPSDLEAAWDVITAMTDTPPARGSVVVVDDVDALASRYPHDYAAEISERLERLVRAAGDAGILVVASAQRLTGSTARLADLFPRRVILGAASRADHIALGGEPSHHTHDQPPGRAHLDGRAVQIAVAHGSRVDDVPEPTAWFPSLGVTGFAARRTPVTRSAVAAWQERGVRVVRVADAAEMFDPNAVGDREAIVVIGDADDWQRQWQVLTAVRSDHALLIDTSAAADFRALSADRALPPFCAPGRPRAWLCREGLPAERVVLPAGPIGPAVPVVAA